MSKMTTVHGVDRTKQRTGYNLQASMRFINNALSRGKSPDAMPARERKYLQRKAEKADCHALYYNRFCFIVSEDNCCVTMYPAPRWFGKRPFYAGKERIRNIRSYTRNNRDVDCEGEMIYGIC